MKTVQINQYGKSDQIEINDGPLPSLQPREVMVRVHHAGVNPIDWKIREGIRTSPGIRFPITLGQDFAGEIVGVGNKVQNFNLGDIVAGFSNGSYAEYVAAPFDKIAIVDDEVSNEAAAALPTPGLTAYQIINEAAQVKEGQIVLIHGASGSVGALAVQFAHAKGAEVIANGSEHDAEYLKNLGAHSVLDHKKDRFEDLVSGVDVVIDLVGGETARRSVKVLKENGVLVSSVGATENLVTGGKHIRTIDFFMRQDAKQLAFLLQMLKNDQLQIRVAQRFTLDEAKAAQDASQFGHLHGKIMIMVP